jgi:SRSO17 transposase
MVIKASFPPVSTEQRFDHFGDLLASSIGHADRRAPLRAYCTGLLLPLERKSVEPMAAAISPANVRSQHQSMHHFVAEAPWDDRAILETVRNYTLPVIEGHGPILAWIVDDTGYPKRGTHSVGVERQYCGQLGKEENCQVAVSLSVANESASLPIAYDLYLPEEWATDHARRESVGIPAEVKFRTKPEIALAQIKQALTDGVRRGVVVADAAFGTDTKFRDALRELKLPYAVAINDGDHGLAGRHAALTTTSLCRDGPPILTGAALRRSINHFQSRSWPSPYHRRSFARWGGEKGAKVGSNHAFAPCECEPHTASAWREEPRPEEWLIIEWAGG